MAPAGHKNAATYALFTDFTDLDWFVIQSRKRQVEYPPRNVPIDATKCLIDFNVSTIMMESMTHGLAVKRPSPPDREGLQQHDLPGVHPDDLHELRRLKIC
jgi:hypothetical protein